MTYESHFSDRNHTLRQQALERAMVYTAIGCVLLGSAGIALTLGYEERVQSSTINYHESVKERENPVRPSKLERH